jgi:hypothetical protein
MKKLGWRKFSLAFAIDVIETHLGESYAEALQKIPPADNAVG